jgi:hypothetical protein
MSADCPVFDCQCCQHCCGDKLKGECYADLDLLANLDLDWEQTFSLNSGYDRSSGYVFSENIEFRPKRDTDN